MASRVGQALQSLDMFGYEVNVHYRGSNKYQTKFGGLCSLITIVLSAWYTCKQFMTVVNGTNSVHLQSDVFRKNSAEMFNFDDYGLEVAVYGETDLIEKGLAKIVATQVEYNCTSINEMMSEDYK